MTVAVTVPALTDLTASMTTTLLAVNKPKLDELLKDEPPTDRRNRQCTSRSNTASEQCAIPRRFDELPIAPENSENEDAKSHRPRGRERELIDMRIGIGQWITTCGEESVGLFLGSVRPRLGCRRHVLAARSGGHSEPIQASTGSDSDLIGRCYIAHDVR